MIYGPKSVIVIAGMNKTASTVERLGAGQKYGRADEYSAFRYQNTLVRLRTVRGLQIGGLCLCLYGHHENLPSAEKRSKSFS